MQERGFGSWGRCASVIRSLVIMLFLGIFLTSCDSGCLDQSNQRRTLELAHRMHGVHPEVTAQLSSLPQLLFTGNVTTLVPAFGSTPQNINGVGLMRQPNCSLTEYFLGSYNSAASTFAVAGTKANYQNTLHTNAGLKTTPNLFLHGCSDSTLGIASHAAVYLGTTSDGSLIAAGIDYSSNLRAGTVDLSAGTYNQSVLAVPGPSGIATADVNGDGKADLVVVASGTGSNFQGAGVYVLLGHGDGTFAAAVEYTAMSVPDGLTVDDVNGDGKLDLVVVGTDNSTAGTGGMQVLLGNGDGTFQTAVASGGVNHVDELATGDFNGDNKKDVVLSGGQILLGNGDGTFAAPAFTLKVAAVVGGASVTPVVGDFNNDGKLDIAINANKNNLISIFLGSGDGTFTSGASYAGIYGTSELSASDLDGDGNLDLIVGIANSGIYGPDMNAGGTFQVLMGNGDGTFQSAPALLDSVFSLSGGIPTFATGDFNGDGKLDIMGVSTFSGTQGLVFLAGDGGGHFAAPAISPEQMPSLVAAGDMNGDGKLDAVYADSNANSVAVALGNGDGTFAAGQDYFLPNGFAIVNIAVADLNGDGKPDVIITAAQNQSTNPPFGLYAYINEGNGTLPLIPIPVDTLSFPTSLAIGDLNGDGKLDIVVTNSPFDTGTAGTLMVYLANGNGTFKPAVSYPAGYSSTGLAIADVNKDGKPDLVFGTNDQAFTTSTLDVLPGNGDGTFGTAISSPLQYTGTTNLAVADFDGDGNADVLVGQCCGLTFTSVSFGKGDGTFPTNYGLATGPASQFVVAADVNGDKRPDILTAMGNAVEVFVNLYGTVVGEILNSTATALTVTPNPASSGANVTFTAQVTGNPGSSIPTGTVIFLSGTTPLGSGTVDGTGKATFTINTLAPGGYAITAQYGGDSSNASSSSTAVTLNISGGVGSIPTTTTLTANATTATVGAQVAFSAVVKPNSGSGVPTGTVSFLDGTSSLGSGTLDGTGTATFSTTSLAAGTHSITASYAGDAGNSASVSTAVSVTVQAAAPSFAISLSPTSTVMSGAGSTTTMVTVTPAGGFNQAVSFACSGLPANATCSFSPPTVTPSGAAATTTLTIQTGVVSALLPIAGGSALTLALGFFVPGLRRRGQLWLWVVLASTFGLAAGCGGGNGTVSLGPGNGNNTPMGTSTVTITGTAGSLTQSAKFTLGVN